MDITRDRIDQLNDLKEIKVEKRDGSMSSFYSYKIDFVLHKLTTDIQTINEVEETLYGELSGTAEVKTSEIAEMIVNILDGLDQDVLAQDYVTFYQKEVQSFKNATNAERWNQV